MKGKKKNIININQVLKEFGNVEKDLEELLANEAEEGSLVGQYEEDYNLEFNHESMALLKDLQKADRRTRITVNSLAKSVQNLSHQNRSLAETVKKIMGINTVLVKTLETVVDEIEELKSEAFVRDIITELVKRNQTEKGVDEN